MLNFKQTSLVSPASSEPKQFSFGNSPHRSKIPFDQANMLAEAFFASLHKPIIRPVRVRVRVRPEKGINKKIREEKNTKKKNEYLYEIRETRRRPQQSRTETTKGDTIKVLHRSHTFCIVKKKKMGTQLNWTGSETMLSVQFLCHFAICETCARITIYCGSNAAYRCSRSVNNAFKFL